MRLVKWSPFMEMEEFDEMFRGLTPGTFTPAIDVYQKKDMVVVETPVPNVDPEKLDISVENDVLTIEGQSEKRSEVDEKDYYRKEVRSGSFQRSISLPVAVDGDKAEAEYVDGVLKIQIPKAPMARKKKIKVKTNKKKN